MKIDSKLFFALLFAAFLVPGPLMGQALIPQTPVEESDPPAEDSVVLRPFPAARITEAFATTGNLIIQSVKMHFTKADLATFTGQVDTLVREINGFLGGQNFNSLEGLGVRDLDQIIARSSILTGRVNALQEQLSTKALELESQNQQLRHNKVRWGLTLESQEEGSTPESRTERIQQAIHKLDSVRSLLQEDVALILEGQDALADRKLRLEELTEKARDMNAVLAKNLLSITRPGFFKDLSSLGERGLFRMHVDKFKSTIKADFAILKTNFLRALVIAAIFLIALLAFTIWFKHNYPRLISEEDFALSKIHLTIIKLPVATSVIIITLMIRLLLNDLPQSFFYLNVIILSVPLTFLAIRIFGSKIRRLIIGLVVIYILLFFYEIAYVPGPLLRIFQMVICLAEFWLFTWLYRMKPFQEEFQKAKHYGFFRGLVIVFSSLPLLGIIANLVGAFRLTEFLSNLPLAIMVLGIAIQVFIRMADSIIYLILSSNLLQRANYIKEDAPLIHRKIVRLVEIFFWLFFLSVVLRLLMVKEAVFDWGRRVLTEGKKIGNLDFTLANILIFFLVIWLSIVLTRILIRILEKDVYTRVSTSKGIPATISLLLRIALITGGFFLAAGAAGMELTNLSIVLGAFSVGIGFGLQNIFNNMVSGLILAFERPIKVGDVVQVGDLVGTVMSIGLRSSTVRSFDGAEVIVPNGNLISDQMINWTKSDSNRRMDIRVGVAYGTDPEVVISLMLDTAAEFKEVWKDPAPKAFFLEFGDSSLNFRLLAWAALEVRLETESALMVTINRKLKEAGIEIPFPQRDLHIRSDATREK